MGHYCRICGRERPNEQFSGKGHRIHVCKRCKAKPKSERQVIEDKDDIFGFMQQSHISEKNVARLVKMAKSENPQVVSLAAIVLKVAQVKPYKTRRLKFLAQKIRNCCDNWKTRAWFLLTPGIRRLRKSPPKRIRKKQKSSSERTWRQQTCLAKRTGRYRFEHD
jgi:hypothetical protein